MTPQNQSQSGHILETAGLLAALGQLKQDIAGIARLAPPPIHLETEADVEKLLSQAARKVIFSLAEEALVNACNHAQADNLYLRLYQADTNVILEIEDNGTGFDLAEVEARYAKLSPDQRPDLKVKERAAAVNAQAAIQSTIGQGTKFTITIPVTGTS